jgi:ribonuclease E
MANKMLIDATHPEETRVVVLRGNRVEEFDFETAHRKQLRGNIYLAKVTRVEPSLQAAFVDYGGNRHGFLAFSEIHPDYYQIPVADRQALIEADTRAQRDEDDDDGGHRRRRGGRHRNRESRRHGRPDDAMRSEQLPENLGESLQPEDMARETGESPSGENVMAEPPPDAPMSETVPAREPEPTDTQAAPESQSVGETANPVVAAEVGAVDPMAQPATDASSEAPVSEQASGDDEGRHSHDADHGPSEGNGNGNGVDEKDDEEEGVESVGGADAIEEVMERAPRYRRPYKIQEVIKRRQVMLVQVVKEERGTKGAALTTYLSLAGRYSVLMPNTARGGGISRKITSTDDRKRLREIADELEVPEGMGVILRTAGASRTKAEVKRDFEYLLRMWETVRDLTLKSSAPKLVYEEGSLAKRSIRDLYTKDIDEIIVAGEDGYKDAKEFMRMLMPSHAKNVKLYKDTQPLFTRYGIESQLDAMFSPTVQLRSGGYIVLNQTEALVSIDVNSGRSTREHHIEDTALKTNIEAAEEVARQLRLRDLAGLIVIDFIDMDEKRNNRTVERRLKDALRNDRARIQVGRISHFGLMEMSRQRIRTSVFESSTEKCPHCGGTGHMRSVSSVALQLLRSLEETLLKGATHNQIVRTRPDIALYVLNHKRAHLRSLEERFRITITISADEEIEGQTAFAIDRGEQVMTMEQAKALLAQQPELTTLPIEEEPEPEFADEEEAAEAEEAPHDEATMGGAASEPMQPQAGEREGGPRRRRRRRRGRGGGGERGPGQDRGHDRGYERGPTEHGQPMPDTMQAGAAQPYEASYEGGAPEGGFAPPQNGGGPRAEGRGEGRGEGHGEGGRRRRRGRRGGRRNRRDREGGFGDHAGAPPPDRSESYEPAHAAPPPDIAEQTYAPRIEPAAVRPAAPPPAPPPAPEPAPEPPRRRSTVREPAPIFGGSTPAPTPMPSAPQPEPSPAASAPEDDANKPRRTGWWAKRMLGGKG